MLWARGTLDLGNVRSLASGSCDRTLDHWRSEPGWSEAWLLWGSIWLWPREVGRSRAAASWGCARTLARDRVGIGETQYLWLSNGLWSLRSWTGEAQHSWASRGAWSRRRLRVTARTRGPVRGAPSAAARPRWPHPRP